MFQIDQENITNTREGYLFVYAQISFNQVRRYANLLDDDGEKDGFRKFTGEFEIEAEILECKISCVLSTALFFEAYAFDYCARKSSTTYVKKYIDKLDPVAKWIIGTKLFCNQGLDQGNEIIGRLGKLFSLRNNLVHHKTKEGDNFEIPPPFPDEFTPEKCIKLVADFLVYLKELDETEEFAEFVLSHINSWFHYAAQESDFYPILWEA